MIRHLTLSWNGEDNSHKQNAQWLIERVRTALPRMRQAFAAEGLAVYSAEDPDGISRVYPIAQDGGVVLGRLFPREMNERATSRSVMLDEESADALLKSNGRALIKAYWGRYIAFVRDPRNRDTFVIPEPSGGVPCYVTRWKELTLLFSHAEDCLALGMPQFSIDWQHIAALVACDPAHPIRTGLREVTRIRPGECLRLHAGAARERKLYWDLVELAQSQPIEQLDAAACAAHETISACIDAWAACYPRIVHCLSGGLDSSIVLACLMRTRAKPQVTCVNLYDRSVGGDERTFARLAASGIPAAAGRTCALMELERDPSNVRVDLLRSVPRAAVPSAYMALCSHWHLDVEASREHAAPLFTGSGGDWIFRRCSSDKPAVDYVWRHGLRKDLLRIALDSTHASGRTFWTSLRQAVTEGFGWTRPAGEPPLHRDPFVDYAVISQFGIDATASPPAVCMQSPWLQSNGARWRFSVAPTKLDHLQSLYNASPDLNPFEPQGEPQWVQPLVSQPICELFARIPAYVLRAGGWDRAVVRRAFASDLPGALHTRHSKGFTDTYIQDVFRYHEPFFYELLVEGVLVKEGFLDRTKVQAFFDHARDGYEEGAARLLGTHLDLEVWLQSWQRPAQRAARAAA